MSQAIQKNKKQKNQVGGLKKKGEVGNEAEDIPKPSTYAKANECSASLTPIFSFP